jgi:4-amino-4-deoxy-L-arabinose transferase-like glycosyltransferase
MTTLVLLTVAVLLLFLVVLFWFLTVIIRLLNNINGNLATCSRHVSDIRGNAEIILPGVGQINRTLGVISGALPLLYGLTEKLTVKTGRL